MTSDRRLEAQKQRMLERDLRQRGIDDPALLAAFSTVPREAFVPDSERSRAYSDRALPLAVGQTVSQPFVVAVMLDALRLTPESKLLEVGAGSGYAAAVAAQVASEVVGLERIGSLAAAAASRLAELGIDNVEIRHADGTDGWPAAAPYDAILVSAAAEKMPRALIAQLKEGGRIVAPLGDRERGQRLMLGIKHADDIDWSQLLDVAFVPLLRGSES